MSSPKHLFVVYVAFALAGCASLDPAASYVEATPQIDQAQLGKAIALYIAERFPPANSTIVVMPPQEDQADNAVGKELLLSLAVEGFAVAQPGTANDRSYHHLRYCVTPLDGGALVRLTVDGEPASRFYTRDTGGSVVAISPFTVRN